jgi:DNA-binding MarR family transcriptional regulator
MVKSSDPVLMKLPCFSANLRRASRVVSRMYAAEVRKGGLEPSQFTLLMALDGLGETTQGELAERLAIDSTTLTRTLLPLERRGWIASRAGTDRRRRWLRITASGKVRMERVRPHWARAQKRLRQALGEESWSALMEGLVHVTRAAEAA